MNNIIQSIGKIGFVILFLLAGWIPSFATHIVGGSLTYKCLGDSTYEITLTVYTDCLFGQADYDKPAWVGIFNEAGNLVDTIFMKFNNKIDTLEQTDPCFIAIPDLCVRVTQYKEIITLPAPLEGDGGFFIVYQRCCRNGTIQNIVEPIETGATYFSFIPESTLQLCNTAPVFKNDPPIFICANEPLNFDHSAFDADGDSLAYELIQPYEGGIFALNPQPRPPYPPPYANVVWSVGYDLSNVMGGTKLPLTLDPVTGHMSAIPEIIGQFVVGVKVKEYRNGELIGETFRDFQYNVVPCLITNAEIDLQDTTLCDEFFVQFNNSSSSAMAYFWDFGDLTTDSDTSSAFQPSYVYPDTGTYTIMLIANPGDFCADTTYATIFIQTNSIDICADISIPSCEDSIILEFKDCSVDPVSPIISWDWSFKTSTGNYQFSTPEAKLVFTEAEELYITYTVESYNGCVATFKDTLSVDFINPPDLVPDTINLCNLEEVYLNPNFDSTLIHLWSPITGLLESPQLPNPKILSTESTTYLVTYTDSLGLCTVEREVELTVLDDLPEVDLIITIPSCVDTAILSATLDMIPPGFTIEWEVITNEGVFIGGGNGIEVQVSSSQLVYVCAKLSADSCFLELCDTIQVNIFPDLDLSDTLVICEGESVALNPGGPTELIYLWSPPDYLDNPMKANPISTPPVSILYSLVLTDTVGLCIVNEEVFVQVNDSTKLLDFDWDIVCDGQTVEFNNLSVNVSDFFWDFGNTNSTSDTSVVINPTYIYPGPGTYQVTLTTIDESVCPQNDSLVKELILEEPINAADFTFDFISCGFPAEIQFFGEEESTYGNVTSWLWQFGSLGTSTEKNPSLEVFSPISLEVTLVVTWDSLCTDTITKIIDIDIFDLNLPERDTLCIDSCIQYGIQALPNLDFTWSPASWVNDIKAANPLICPDSDGLLTLVLQITLPNGDVCEVKDTINFTLVPCSDIFKCDSLPDDLTSCLELIVLEVDSCHPDVVLIWCSPDGDTLAQGPVFEVPISEYDFIILKTIGLYGYMKMDTIYLDFLEYTVPVTATSEPYTIFKGQSSQLVADAPTATSFTWAPPETLSDPFIFNPLASPDITTIYVVFVVDQFGCTGSDTTLVTVRDTICDEPYIFVPNTFTPNGDNLNDVLFVRGNYIDIMEFYLYNRWGELVFESRDKNVGWDGRYKGELLRTDVFGYYLKCKCLGGEEFFKRGNVTLLRN
ncbi:MAG: gliding motility-associated C-terminal domain-containing protein [Saprospiraceae bacterium]|nr:gliding motility-associated C-terminal domain-containing protein [Saprospiraceae bacterium]